MPKQPLKRIVSQWLVVLIGASAFSTLAGQFGQFHWLLDLFSHFNVHAVVTQIVLLGVALWIRRFWVVPVLGALIALNVTPLLPYFGATAPPTSDVALRLSSINLSGRNDEVAKVLRYITNEQPDVLVLQEYTHTWQQHLPELKSQFPFFVESPSEDFFGIALFSRYPLRDEQVWRLGGATKAIRTTIESPDGVIDVIGLHLMSPGGARNTGTRNRQFEALSEIAAAVNKPTVYIGDFNAAPWSWVFQRWLKSSDLDHGASTAPFYTWPTFLSFLGIPIDACVVTRELRIVRQRRGESVGSDHYPLTVELGWNPT